MVIAGWLSITCWSITIPEAPGFRGHQSPGRKEKIEIGQRTTGGGRVQFVKISTKSIKYSDVQASPAYFGDLVSMAATVALDTGYDHCLAIETAELGCGLLANT